MRERKEIQEMLRKVIRGCHTRVWQALKYSGREIPQRRNGGPGCPAWCTSRSELFTAAIQSASSRHCTLATSERSTLRFSPDALQLKIVHLCECANLLCEWLLGLDSNQQPSG